MKGERREGGIGDWGLGTGDWNIDLLPVPSPQHPVPKEKARFPGHGGSGPIASPLLGC